MLVYQDLAEKVIDADARNVLTHLSRSEESHVARLIEIFSAWSEEGRESLDLVDVIKIFRSRGQETLLRAFRERGLTEESPVGDILDFAREAERRAYEHYRALADGAEDEGVKALFLDLAEEEKNHEVSVIRLRDLFD
ncbi:MAG: hypothetical protein D6713_04135 [Deltaproteobacteria bacterium]|nr:MAG: hypothetical protein D6713_04135 [Deltaproteobacteria bacterium]